MTKEEEKVIEDKYITEILSYCTSDDWEVNGVQLDEILYRFLLEIDYDKLAHVVDSVKRL